ncbi:MAG: DVU_1556 family methyltransferase [Desulfopila sp.]
MTALYLSEPVRKGLGPCLRPGGAFLTHRILALVEPARQWRIVDAGCGTGASLAIMAGYGLTKVFGIDRDRGLLAEAGSSGQRVVRADLARLPLAAHSLDMILCECAWNLTDKARSLAEFARVLQPGGMLAVTDIYLRAGQQGERGNLPVHSCFAQATSLHTVRQQLRAAGFIISRVEDHTPLLTHTAAEFIFAHGSLMHFWQAVTGDAASGAAACDMLHSLRPGLFLLLASRATVTRRP